MALIRCPECKRQVSDRASTCPACAYPLKPATVIEATGKPWKFVQLISAVGFFIGMFAFCATSTAGQASPSTLIVALAGFIGYIIGRIGGWWYHH